MAKLNANSVPSTVGAPSADPSLAKLGLNPHDNTVRNAKMYFMGRRSISGQEVDAQENQQGANTDIPCHFFLKDYECYSRCYEDPAEQIEVVTLAPIRATLRK